MDNNICQTCLSRNRRLIGHQNLSAMFQEINIWEVQDTNEGICWECHHMLLKFLKFKKRIRQAQLSIIYMVQDTKALSQLSIITKNRYDYEFFHRTDPLRNVGSKCLSDIVKQECLTVEGDVSTINDDEKQEESPVVSYVDPNKKNQDLSKNGDELPNSIDDDKPTNDISDYSDELLNCSGDEKPVVDIESKLGASSERIYAVTNVPIVKHKIKSQRKKTVKQKLKNQSNEKTVKRKLKKESQPINEEDVKEKFSTIVYTVEEMLTNRETKRNQPNFKKIPFKCDSCVLGFTRKETYDVHFEKKHSEKNGKYICDVCLIRFPKKKSIERHCSRHFVSYRCRLCQYETAQLGTALNHCRGKHSGDQRDKIHCKQCNAVVKTPEDLAEHMKTQHYLICSKCGEKFKGRNTLRAHMARIHSAQREFICDLCCRAFFSKSRLESHMVSHNPTLARRLAFCDKCCVQYKNIYVYRHHLRNSANHAERAYPCPVCGKKFVSKAYFKKHYNFYHLRKSEFNCGECKKIFISEWRLKNHKQKHHGLHRQRDHACNICGKKFYSQSTLAGHRLTHSAQRSFLCEDCGDSFKQRPALYTHAHILHGAGRRGKAH